MPLHDLYPLFPELQTDIGLQEFLTPISGSLAEDYIAPADRTADLAELGTLCTEQIGDGPAMFDAFARSYCAPYRVQVERTFEGSPLTVARAAQLTTDFLAWLTERVQQTTVRTLVVVLDLLRRAEALPGETGDERLWHFCHISGLDAFREQLFVVFPELGRQLAVLADNGVRHLRRMLDATTAAVADGRLPTAATGSPRPVLTAISYGLGDSHGGGKTVCRLTFSGDRALVYKPRAMDVEHAYAAFVSRIDPDLPVLSVWCGDDCGWQEYADQGQAAPAPAYFHAAGRLLAVLHVLRASDMHYENVLNHRGLPVVVDAESLFSVNRRAGDGREQSAEIQALAQTVFSVGLLPTRIGAPGVADASIDIGFLGYVPGQQAVTTSPVLTDFGTDQPRVGFTAGTVETAAIRPAGDRRSVELQQLCAGFAETYDWILDHVGRVEAWLRELFPGVAVRSVLEATSKYQKLLQTASHPTFQQSTPLKELLLHRIGLGRIDHLTPPVVRAEIRDLLQGDVPYFSLRTDSTWVYHHREAVADVLAQPPLAQTIAGLRAMSPGARDRNLRIIRAAYVDLTEPECDAPAYAGHTVPSAPARTRDLVDALAAELTDAVVAAGPGGRPGWIGATIRDTTQEFPWRVDGLGDDLYAGVAGIALFLAAAGVLTDEARYRTLARDVLCPRVQALLDDPTRRRRQVSGGMAGGYPGLAFTALEVARLSASAELAELGAQLWSRIPEDLPLLEDADFLMGSAGLLAASVTVESGAVTEAAFQHLRGRLDLKPAPDQRLYSGFAHGTSGTLASLARYAAAADDGRVELASLSRIHEGLYDPGAGHWPISNLAPERVARGWCHGTPGVLLGVVERLVAGAPPSDDPRNSVGVLAETVADTCLGLNLSLCHGDIGNLLILAEAAGWDPSGRIADRVADRHAELVTRIVPGALAARVGKSVLNDSAYVGTAGIGLGMILLTGEVDVASPLTLRRNPR
ncbi:type 2 lantibiotic biosynthesis protein LanM [Krasilnikovia cinnamomea]|uniref:Type 2 lantibiotic biosynthesis protein LanM n=1 Tax=Krasilnikovia cinnamomea TaxID=349313 RepID=A0A4Q7ZL71_9ACTN|nr:type 2 lanthipeptide synthetase LanM family protein [Krasilnikovia cinnamomea]RZU51331.1 type 2 lantibiotic biosynthesis protein LanM [Krasilnikovia cinnamomea]